MRMWMVNPKIMCREHLLGEWRELKMFCGTLKRRKKDGSFFSLKKYFDNQLIEPQNIYGRHLELKKEMLRRGYNPKIVITPEDIDLSRLTREQLLANVPREWSLDQLLYHSRANKKGCIACQKQYSFFKKTFKESPYSALLFKNFF